MDLLNKNPLFLSSLEINGPLVVAEFELFGITLRLTESVTVQWVIMLILGTLFFILGRNLKVKPEGKRQAFAEMVVTFFTGTVKDTMGGGYRRYSPYIGTLFCFSLFLSLSGLMGFRPPTSDISVILAWGVITFILVQRNRFKTGRLWGGLKSYTDPIPVMLPMNIVGELANPLSQSFRHYGNILGGLIIGSIVYWALGNFALVVPAVLSIYFDIFGAVVHAFIFSTLTMVYVAGADCGE
ncbi:MAG: F0F1 ATP synthase subunit A [Oscillospiraceae bacterium]|nr:F0F1 ATP synthase subunit A [Oscillospiraceae bacterium]